MTIWQQPRWHPDQLVPPHIYAGRGFARSYAWAASRGQEIADGWGANRAPRAANGQGGGAVLLGGAGLLGQRIVEALLELEEDSPVTVVSRNPGSIVQAWTARLGAVHADRLLANPRLHLVAADLAWAGMDWMAGVPHCSHVFYLVARLDAFASSSQLQEVNVGSLAHGVALARRDGAVLQAASTLSLCVSSNWTPVGEPPPPQGDDLWLYGGYAQTKACAEFALARVGGDINWQVVRHGLLVPGRGEPYPPDHFLPRMLRALNTLGGLPSHAEQAWVDLTPVDGAARTAVAIARRGGPGVYHWANPVGTPLSGVVDALQKARQATGLMPLQVAGTQDWLAGLEGLPGLDGALLYSAFAKSRYLETRASRAPVLNVDLFQATGRRFCTGRAQSLGCALPARPQDLLPHLPMPAAMPAESTTMHMAALPLLADEGSRL